MAETANGHHSQTVLIASDDYFLAESIERSLEQIGVAGLVIRRSTLDYDEFNFNLRMPIDLLIVDIRKLEQDRSSLVGELRKSFLWQMVFVESAYAEVDEFFLINGGLSELLRWPTSSSFLIARIKHHLEVSMVAQRASGVRLPEGPSIALVDDDKNILESLAPALIAQGYRVATYTDGVLALEAFAAKRFDLAVLDIKMPRMDGKELFRRLREISDVPVVFLTSKEEESDEAEGLQSGAEDYIKKPFTHRLVISRIRSILQRVSTEGGVGKSILECDQLRMDLDRYSCTLRARAIKLTVTEFHILWKLASHPGLRISRNELKRAAVDDETTISDQSMDNYIKRLRAKLRRIDPSFDNIELLYGAGYRYIKHHQ